jgi:hypothetical protein
MIFGSSDILFGRAVSLRDQVLLVASAIGLGTIAIYLLIAATSRADRCTRREVIGRRLGTLSVGQQAAVLLALRDDACADTRAMVKALIDDLRLPTEPIPASAPPGRGDEASPTSA